MDIVTLGNATVGIPLSFFLALFSRRRGLIDAREEGNVNAHSAEKARCRAQHTHTHTHIRLTEDIARHRARSQANDSVISDTRDVNRLPANR